MHLEILRTSPWFFKALDHLFPATAVALWPFILVRDVEYLKLPAVLNHERIHHAQQRELLVLPMVLIYWVLVAYWWIRSGSLQEAYLHSPFEQEAYENEQNLIYLMTRPRWAWTSYMRPNPRVLAWKELHPGERIK